MAPCVQVDIADGSVKLPELELVIRQGVGQASVETMLAEFRNTILDHGNGFSWVNVGGVTFGTMPCTLAFGFHEGALTQVHFGVDLPDAPIENGWPTREAIDEEIAFVRKIFRTQLQREFGDNPERFVWGDAWSRFDSKGFIASSGIRFA